MTRSTVDCFPRLRGRENKEHGDSQTYRTVPLHGAGQQHGGELEDGGNGFSTITKRRMMIDPVAMGIRAALPK